jgi:predicted transcriptional regulator
MRTTVTLDPDVAAALKEAARRRGTSFKEVLNEAVRQGLGARPVAREYQMPSRPMGLRAGVDIDKALALAASEEDAETLRKLELRK